MSDPCSGVPFPCGDTIDNLRTAPWFPDSAGIIGRALLDRVVCLYATYGVDLPKRQVWTAGEVAVDCNQLSVSLDGLAEGLVPEGEIPNPCHVPVNATYKIAVTRCHQLDAKGGPTSTDELGRAGDAAARDAYLLMKLSGCLDMFGADVAATTGGPDMDVFARMGTDAGIEISGPQGGMITTTLTLQTVIG